MALDDRQYYDYCQLVESGQVSSPMTYEEYKALCKVFAKAFRDGLKEVEMPTKTRREIHAVINKIQPDDLWE